MFGDVHRCYSEFVTPGEPPDNLRIRPREKALKEGFLIVAFSSSRTRAAHAPLDTQYTIRDAADLLGVGESTLRRMIARGDLRAYRYLSLIHI